MAELDEIEEQLRARLEGSDLIERLADRVGVTARASAVFGEPVEREGVTVIPVAKARWGFGGGAGGEGENQGSGGGGGGLVSPLGYIEVRAGGAEFKPLGDPRRSAAVAVALLGLAALLLSRRR